MDLGVLRRDVRDRDRRGLSGAPSGTLGRTLGRASLQGRADDPCTSESHRIHSVRSPGGDLGANRGECSEPVVVVTPGAGNGWKAGVVRGSLDPPSRGPDDPQPIARTTGRPRRRSPPPSRIVEGVAPVDRTPAPPVRRDAGGAGASTTRSVSSPARHPPAGSVRTPTSAPRGAPRPSVTRSTAADGSHASAGPATRAPSPSPPASSPDLLTEVGPDDEVVVGGEGARDEGCGLFDNSDFLPHRPTSLRWRAGHARALEPRSLGPRSGLLVAPGSRSGSRLSGRSAVPSRRPPEEDEGLDARVPA